MSIETIAGIINARVSGHQVTVKLTAPEALQLNERLLIGTEEHTIHCVNTGVPHAVLFTDTLHQIDINQLGATIRYHERFSPAGTNVNFVTIENSVIKIRTYERGVEAETKACGTGATAAAVISAITGQSSLPVTLETVGGEQLTVNFDMDSDQVISNVTLKGNATLVYKGELSPEALDD
jgi:diaminopimelate epimerase